MFENAFDLPLIQLLFDHRTPALTAFFQFFTFLGEIEGYVLVIAFVHVAYDKKLAVRLAVLALATMSLNHVLKTFIANPRPFVSEGSYAAKWAVSPAKAAELAAEFSTPSGHAMAGASFYTYVFASVRRPSVRVGAVVLLVLIGLSRPYLGVHYLEDIFLGWAIGIPIALLAARFGDRLRAAWNGLRFASRALLVVGASSGLVLATSPLYESTPHGQPLPFVSYLGFLSGILVAVPLEAKWVGFDPRSGGTLQKALRLAISASLVLGALVLFDPLFASVASDGSPLGNVLRYVRYALAGVLGVLFAPFVFVRLGLATSGRPGPYTG